MKPSQQIEVTLPDSCTASEAQLLIDRHTVAQLTERTEGTMTRQEHLQWCKQRALDYVDHGALSDALASMLSDLGKHPDTEGSLQTLAPLAMMLEMGGQLRTPQQMREFINGFN